MLKLIAYFALFAFGICVAAVFALASVMAFLMRGLGDEPGRRASTVGALMFSVLLLAVAVAGGFLARMSWRKAVVLRSSR